MAPDLVRAPGKDLGQDPVAEVKLWLYSLWQLRWEVAALLSLLILVVLVVLAVGWLRDTRRHRTDQNLR